MSSPSYEDRFLATFDSFCKTVSRNFIRDLICASERRNKYISNEPVEYFLDLLSHEDSYPSDAFLFYINGNVYAVNDERLYEALASLSEKQRNVLLLKYWSDLTDEEIAREMEVTTRTVYNLRKKAFRTIREYYGKKSADQTTNNGFS